MGKSSWPSTPLPKQNSVERATLFSSLLLRGAKLKQCINIPFSLRALRIRAFRGMILIGYALWLLVQQIV
jgi:hypothetical protein